MLNFDWRPPVVWVEWSKFFLGSTWDKMEGFLLAEVKYKLLLLLFFAFNSIVHINQFQNCILGLTCLHGKFREIIQGGSKSGVHHIRTKTTSHT